MPKFFLGLSIIFFLLSSCTYTIKIRDGKTAFEQKQYHVAAAFLEKEFAKAERRTEKGKIALQLGTCYQKTNQPDKALPWLKQAYDLGAGIDALKAYARSLKSLERYSEAIEAYELLGVEIGSPYEFRKDITSCKVAQDWLKETQISYQVVPLEFNSAASDFAPLPYREDKLLFSSDWPAAAGDQNYAWTGRDFMDVFEADLTTGAVIPYRAGINSPDNEGSLTFSSDFNEVFFTRCTGDEDNVSYCRIFYSKLAGNEWSLPKPLTFEEGKANYMHPYLSEDGNFLYFASDVQGGWGGYDIYVSERNTGGWDTPKLLGRSINTEANDVFPFVQQDTLYFSSEGHTGMGGLDIFRVYRIGKDAWSAPQNLKPPLNSGQDDFGFVLDTAPSKDTTIHQRGYFSSARPGGKGGDDIYRFEKKLPALQPTLPAKDTLPVVYKILLDVYVVEKIFSDSEDPNSKVLGRRPVGGAKVAMRNSGQPRQITTSEDGYFSLELEAGADYQFLAVKDGYLNSEQRFSTRGLARDPANPVQRFEVEVLLERIFKNKEIILREIYYDFDKWDIRDDAKPTLDELAANLLLNPGLRIQLASHTDCRGNDSYNLELSQKRAQSAVNYLIGRDVPTARLTARGFGESVPAASCACNRCTEEEHQTNRRTTFTILE
jgi:outer membrane protein OmpA-like peptidoglycan-associated protein